MTSLVLKPAHHTYADSQSDTEFEEMTFGFEAFMSASAMSAEQKRAPTIDRLISCVVCALFFVVAQNLDTMLIKTPDLIEAMIELACSRRWLQSTIYVIDFSQKVVQGLWLNHSSLLQVRSDSKMRDWWYAVDTSFGMRRRVKMLLLG